MLLRPQRLHPFPYMAYKQLYCLVIIFMCSIKPIRMFSISYFLQSGLSGSFIKIPANLFRLTYLYYFSDIKLSSLGLLALDLMLCWYRRAFKHMQNITFGKINKYNLSSTGS